MAMVLYFGVNVQAEAAKGSSISVDCSIEARLIWIYHLVYAVTFGALSLWCLSTCFIKVSTACRLLTLQHAAGFVLL